MRHCVGPFALLAVLALVADGSAQRQVRQISRQLLGFTAFGETLPFPVGERCSIVVFGDRPNIPMGLYVFDPHGNCVAHDDAGDDLAVEWYPPATRPYAYEIRNLGIDVTGFEASIR